MLCSGSKSASYQFNPQIEKRAEGKVKQLVRMWDKDKAAIVNAKGLDGKVMYRETDQRTVDDVWRISCCNLRIARKIAAFPRKNPRLCCSGSWKPPPIRAICSRFFLRFRHHAFGSRKTQSALDWM